jgi:hypothetical protein
LCTGIQTSLVSHGCIRPDVRSTDAQVEQDRSRNDWNSGDTYVETNAALFQVAHDTASRIQTEGRSSRQQEGVRLLDEMHRAEHVCFACAGCPAALVHSSDSPLFAQNNRTAGQGVIILSMAHF